MSDPIRDSRSSPVLAQPVRSASPIVLARPAAPVAEPLEEPVEEREPVVAEPLPANRVRPKPEPFLIEVTRVLYSIADWMFGAFAILAGLAILTAVPVAQFLVLGYLLEVSGRIARTGKFKEGFVGIRHAARLGRIAVGCVLWWLPLWGMAYMASAAHVIDPEGPIARRWEIGLIVASVFYALHVSFACLHGGRLRYFFWPFNFVWVIRKAIQGNLYRDAVDGLWNFVVALRLPYYFWLGLRGFVGAFLYLALPLALLGFGHKNPAVGILGAVLLGIVVLYVPFLQTRFARENRFRAFIEFRAVRADYRRAPVAFFAALFCWLLFAIPLYLLKIEVIPQDLVFLEGIVFLLFMLPVRFAAGWAFARAGKRQIRRHWFFRWTCRFLMIPVITAYVFVVFTSQHLGWRGIPSLYEQHAFLLPVPFVGSAE